MTAVRVVLPAHLRTLAGVPGEVRVPVPAAGSGSGAGAGSGPGPVGGSGSGSADGSQPLTQRAILDALEASFPVLCGTIRDRRTGRRRAFIRFFACEQDLSNEPPDAPLPDSVAAAVRAGREPFLVVGAMAGG